MITEADCVKHNGHYFRLNKIFGKYWVENFAQIKRYPTKIACHFDSHLGSKY